MSEKWVFRSFLDATQEPTCKLQAIENERDVHIITISQKRSLQKENLTRKGLLCEQHLQ